MMMAAAALVLVEMMKQEEQETAQKKGKTPKKKKTMWMRPLSHHRKEAGHFVNLLPMLKNEDPGRFRNYSRFPIDQYDELLQRLTPRLEKRETKMRKPLEPELKLACTLRHLATGDSYASLSYNFYIAPNTVCNVVREVCQAIIDEYGEEMLDCPSTPEEWKKIADQFWRKWNFPHCCGALDGKHVKIKKPQNGGSLYFNYKKFHSIVLMAVVDADYKFLYIDVGQPGSNSDGGVWNNTDLAEALEEERAGFPEAKKLPGEEDEDEEGREIPYAFVADDAFALRPWIMKPYPYTSMPIELRRFNYRLSRARRVVENAFGIMAMRFRFLLRTIEQAPKTVEIMLHAACILHNMLRNGRIADQGHDGEGDRINQNGEIIEGGWRARWKREGHQSNRLKKMPGNTSHKEAKKQREYLTDYFSSDKGSVAWQDKSVP
jgi:hypothetical protein